MQNSRTFHYYSRSIEDRWLEVSDQFPVLLLTGPRQVGKTTVLEHIREEDRTYVTLDDLAIRGLAREDPELFFQRFKPPVLIDEIQYAPQLLPSIKRIVDQNRLPGYFWLTGSQQFHLMKGVTESLAGRVAIVNLLGFSSREREKRPLTLDPFIPKPALVEEYKRSRASSDLIEMYEKIWMGSFPVLATSAIRDREIFYRSYVQTYLERDVRELIQIGDLETFRRFLVACAARTGQLLNYSDLARDVGVSVNTAKKWLSVLVSSFQVFLLQPFHSNITKRLSKTPKLYFLDTGLCAYLTGWSSPQTLESGAMSGAILETYVFVEILKSWWHRIHYPDIYFYRDKDKREIDFILMKDGRLYPIEVKKAVRVERKLSRIIQPLASLGEKIDSGAIISLYPQVLPISECITSIPIGIL